MHIYETSSLNQVVITLTLAPLRVIHTYPSYREAESACHRHNITVMAAPQLLMSRHLITFLLIKLIQRTWQISIVGASPRLQPQFKN